MPINLFSPQQLKLHIACRAKEKRLSLNWSRKSLSERTGISSSTIKRFESTGNISLEALLQLALALDSLKEFDQLFTNKIPVSLFEQTSVRERGRN